MQKKKERQRKLDQSLTLKILGESFTPPVSYLKNVFLRERVKPCFFVTFDITLSHIFLEDFIETPQVVQKI